MASAPLPQLDPLQKLQLRSHLLALPFAAFACCLADLLTAVGYQDVHLAGRTQWKGRNRQGGHDLEAMLPSGLGHRRVVVQAKQFGPQQRVYQRTVDELRGVVLREWAGEGLLLTTGPVSTAIQKEENDVIPIRLMDGEALFSLLAKHQVGLQEVHGRLVVDEAYFERLIAHCPRPPRPGDKRGRRQTKEARIESPQTVTLTLTLPVTLVSSPLQA